MENGKSKPYAMFSKQKFSYHARWLKPLKSLVLVTHLDESVIIMNMNNNTPKRMRFLLLFGQLKIKH